MSFEGFFFGGVGFWVFFFEGAFILMFCFQMEQMSKHCLLPSLRLPYSSFST
jgi:hypothetical protein